MGWRTIGAVVVVSMVLVGCKSELEPDGGAREMEDVGVGGCCPMSSFSELCDGRGGLGGPAGAPGCDWRAFDGVYRQTTDEHGCPVWENLTSRPHDHPSSEVYICPGAAGCCPTASPSEICNPGSPAGGSVPMHGCDHSVAGGDGVWYLDPRACPTWVDVTDSHTSYPADELVRCGEADAGTGEADAGTPALLPASECACIETSEPAPASLPWPEESTCFDGCNWCACSTEGLVRCTARACDAGVGIDAGSDSGA